jgi:hypothetical protein
MKHDTPNRALILKWIWILVLPLCTSLNTPANAVEIKDIDKYKIYIHIKVMNYKEFVCIEKLWSKENRLWDPYAKNPKSSAFGIPQLLKLKERNPYVQMDLGYKYLLHRYSKRGKDGAGCNALAFHLKHGWY